MINITNLSRKCFAVFLTLTAACSSHALELYDGRTLTKSSATQLSIQELVAKIPKGAIVVIGEQHNYGPIQQGQLSILNELRTQGHSINVGMEFLKYTIQDNLDAYRAGRLSEAEFQKSSWGQANFNFYREQMLFPNLNSGERTFAINSPTELPVAVKTKGLANLSEEEKALLPPHFELGGENYRKRFAEKMKWHVTTEESMNKYFETQSLWDDTMAWKTCEAANSSTNTMVVVVGQFHVEYGDGLIHRIRTRCGTQHPIISIYQFLFFEDEEIDLKHFLPSSKYGPVSDFVMAVK